MNDNYEQDMNQDIERGVSHFPNESLEITRVEKLRGREARYMISFGKYELSVLEDVMIKYRMIKGNSFHKTELEEIVIADEKQRAYVQSLKFLERKPRTRHEMTQKLKQKEYMDSIIEDVLLRLERERLIDDEFYAKEWARQRISNHRKGKLWVGQELRQKGIAKDHIQLALGEVSVEEEWDSAMTAGRKKWDQVKGDMLEKKRKTYPFLMRRGYSGEVTRKVIGQLQTQYADEHAGEVDEEEMMD
ncbi:regulatory protein RecX [Paenibacillus provencensis]|uniref:Regulatory protein RecX n=1 Tax=Paenibacillus provencensis TaxID=441151 RepID=A0ABW3Q5F9_9BACL|nr:RecX family transcriptional regulator [Paenibacillus sp. MER 78]MCM3128788.1 RecX family transcriptional regulator [Paenibacillus sp. MER 78]